VRDEFNARDFDKSAVNFNLFYMMSSEPPRDLEVRLVFEATDSVRKEAKFMEITVQL